MIIYSSVEEFMGWIKTKSELKFNPQPKTFPIYYNCIYWAFLGCNLGSEEGKHRPVVITRTYKNSTMVTIIPLTSKRLNDGYQFHVDMETVDSTALVEQMRVIDVVRIEKPMYKNGKILSLTNKDLDAIDVQVRRQYLISKPKKQKKPDDDIKKIDNHYSGGV